MALRIAADSTNRSETQNTALFPKSPATTHCTVPSYSFRHLHASCLQKVPVMSTFPQDSFILHIKPGIDNIFLACFILRSIFFHKYWNNQTAFSLFHTVKVCCNPCQCWYRMARSLSVSWQDTTITSILQSFFRPSFSCFPLNTVPSVMHVTNQKTL